jgi:predicted unusual protein kinase regulating ubiquinone biosynthesis (AarF/ABC1/UbiB family)
VPKGSETPNLAPPSQEWTRILGIGCLATVAAAGGWFFAWRRRPSGHTGGVLRRNRAGRNAEVARLGAKVGTTYATTAARKVFASAERREELDRSREMQNAEDIANSLGQMKGALMKIAQMAGYLDEGLPEPMRLALSQLQSQAPPMAPELAAQVIEQELGAHPDQIFVTWDPVPIAAASIGQVHRAVWKDPSGVERAVAVKVQYPGVDEAIRSDLDNTELVGTMFRAMFKGLDPKPMVAEIRARIGEELDYEREAKNQRLFADNFRGHPFIHVPDVIDQLSTGRVLTTELATGSTWGELLTWDQSERDLAAETIFRFVFRSLYRFQAFNGDPHPGNYLFEKGGRVTFLDFGLVKYFSNDELDVFKRMISSAVLTPDWDRFRSIIEEAGLLRKDAPIDTEEAGKYFSHFYSFVQIDDVITWSSDYASATVRQTFDRDSPIAQYASVPTSFVIIQRINLGLYALLGQLNASGNYRRIAEELWPMTSAPASTPLGEAEAAWLATLPH